MKKKTTDNEIYLPEAKDDVLSIKYRNLTSIIPLEKNFKGHDLAGIAASLQERGIIDPIGVDDSSRENFNGNGRAEALLWLKQQGGKPPAKVVVVGEDWFVPTVSGVAFETEAQRVAAAAALNRLNFTGGFDAEGEARILRELLEAGENKATGYTDDDVSALIAAALSGGSNGGQSSAGKSSDASDGASGAQSSPTLADRFGFPPFSVLDARSGAWQKRKAAWLSLGIKSEEGRGRNALDMSATAVGITDEAEREAWNEKRRKGGARSEAAEGETTIGAVPRNTKRLLARSGAYSKGKNFKPDSADGDGTNLLQFSEAAKDIQFYRKVKKLQALRAGDADAPAAAPDGYEHNRGLLGFSDSGNDPEYYRKKQAVEAALAFEITREEFQLIFYEGSDTLKSGTSIFDPVLCELMYSWFCPPLGRVLDPFAGGSVRGIVAARLGRLYTGVDLREEQVAANNQQAEDLLHGEDFDFTHPRWIVGDSLFDLPDEKFNFVFSCPPYYDLEVYSDDERDLSAATSFADFCVAYSTIIKSAVDRLEDDSFAVFVVGEIRDKKSGIYQNFVGETIRAFEAAGADYYNEMILVTAVGSLPIRAGRQFASGRKIGKTHQNVLVFVKGDGKKAAEKVGDVEVFNFFSAPDSAPEAETSSDASEGGLVSEADLQKKFEKMDGGEV